MDINTQGGVEIVAHICRTSGWSRQQDTGDTHKGDQRGTKQQKELHHSSHFCKKQHVSIGVHRDAEGFFDR